MVKLVEVLATGLQPRFQAPNAASGRERPGCRPGGGVAGSTAIPDAADWA
jgi:hypothetical protein